ncbi:Probable phenylacetic acid degradation NADH oxidoreductase paaE [Alloactinosynnema sp. L-07]|uniref:ferredoxin--NADP reductase n=1 Tax=Alloactinosynnema sp. L-07 TaxID=1653480 RepID=UPI00065F01AE|nr:ferredoxin--NADP reductase [Alloactinosynnema sp. L-07]CRK57817.1 Probable phenylacetic acid degradation NADH oxidoreductase paaE [Alloactinosynnema sp. L-07]
MSLQVRVVEVIRETADAHSLVLEPVDGSPVSYRPGQFITIRVPSDRDGGAARCYSLCSSPALDEKPKVTVKRTAGGYASNWICDHVVAGTVLDVLKPSGTFTPKDFDDDLLLFAGGSGITPVLSILKTSLYVGTGAVTLVYANRDPGSVIFGDELAALSGAFGDRLEVLDWLESTDGLPTADRVAAVLAARPGRQSYICGPGPFMDLVAGTLRSGGVPTDHVHVERFTSLHENPFDAVSVVLETGTPESTVEVTLDGDTRSVTWPQGNRLLDVLLAAGIEAPFSCREGACSACACVLLEGEVDLERNEVLDAADLADGLILACQARPRTDRLRVTYDA